MTQKSSINYGIQGNVQADAVAVGPHATAVATAPAKERDDAIQKLSEAVQRLQLASSQQQLLLEHFEALKAEPPAQHASTLDKIVSVLKEAGKLTGVVAPLKGLAAVLGIPLPF
jgi:hypothetical protein